MQIHTELRDVQFNQGNWENREGTLSDISDIPNKTYLEKKLRKRILRRICFEIRKNNSNHWQAV